MSAASRASALDEELHFSLWPLAYAEYVLEVVDRRRAQIAREEWVVLESLVEIGRVAVSGDAEWQAQSPEAPYGSLRVVARSLWRASAGFRAEALHASTGLRASVEFCADEVVLSPLVPGDWWLTIAAGEEDFRIDHPAPLTVRGGAQTDVVLDTRVASGTLTVLEASGEPVDGWLRVEPAGADAAAPHTAEPRVEGVPATAPRPLWKIQRRTDGYGDNAGTGRLELELPVGSFRISYRDHEGQRRKALVRWSESGPEPSTLVLR